MELHLYTPYTPKNFTVIIKVKAKSVAVPLQAWRGREGCRRLRLPDFKTINT